MVINKIKFISEKNGFRYNEIKKTITINTKNTTSIIKPMLINKTPFYM